MRETRLRRWRTRRSAFRKQSVESHACSLCKAPRQRTCRTVNVPFVICQGAKKSQRSLGIIPRCCINDCRQVDSSSRDQLNEKRREIRVARLYCAGCGSQTTTVGNRSVAANRSTAADQSRLKKDDGLSRWFTRPSLPGAEQREAFAVLGRRTPRLTARRVCVCQVNAALPKDTGGPWRCIRVGAVYVCGPDVQCNCQDAQVLKRASHTPGPHELATRALGPTLQEPRSRPLTEHRQTGPWTSTLEIKMGRRGERVQGGNEQWLANPATTPPPNRARQMHPYLTLRHTTHHAPGDTRNHESYEGGAPRPY